MQKMFFFGVVFLKNAASGGKYKLCTLSDASCQGASFATLFGCVPANWAEKTSKNSSKIEKATLCGQCGHKMRKLRSETLVMLEFMAEWTTQH